jgi:hypothetical protein
MHLYGFPWCGLGFHKECVRIPQETCILSSFQDQQRATNYGESVLFLSWCTLTFEFKCISTHLTIVKIRVEIAVRFVQVFICCLVCNTFVIKVIKFNVGAYQLIHIDTF